MLLVWLVFAGLIAAAVVLAPSRLGLAAVVVVALVAPALLLRGPRTPKPVL